MATKPIEQGKMRQPKWLEDGMEHIWLPYAQMKNCPTPLPVAQAKGNIITLTDGRKLVDGIASWWTAAHGHAHPKLIAAYGAQLEQMPHIMFAGLAHEPAMKLAVKLAEITPNNASNKGLTRSFFSDSGSTAVEVALKIALQYWRNLGNHNKRKFICFENGYHGDTFGAMSVSDPNRSMHAHLSELLHRQFVLPIPNDEYSLAEFEHTVAAIADKSAAMIIEPLIQAAGGMKFHSADMLAAIANIARKYDILFIADEIAVGFGRSGMLFACDEAGICPDIMCLGKALTGGICTMGVTMATEQVFQAFYDDDLYKALMHGPTYTANPLACAAALASLDLFDNEPRIKQVANIENQMLMQLEELEKLQIVKDIRIKGAIGVIELHEQYFDMWWLRQRFIELGVWLRPFAGVIYLAPSFTISEEDLNFLLNAIQTILLELEANIVMHIQNASF